MRRRRGVAQLTGNEWHACAGHFALACRRSAEISATLVSSGMAAMVCVRLQALIQKCAQLAAVQQAAFGHLHGQRIDLGVVDADLVMQMRTGGQAGRAAIGEDLALAHARAARMPAAKRERWP